MISIIGAGPVGCYTAYLLAKAGKKVQVFEEHSKIGKPVQCTGIVTKEIEKIIPEIKSSKPKQGFLVNTFDKARIYAPDNSFFEFNTKEYLIDRQKFDKYMADKAKKAGAIFHLNSRIEKIKRSSINPDKITLKTKNKAFETKKLIGADGPNSIVSKHLNNPKPDAWIGMQAIAKGKFDSKTYQVHLGACDFFAWIVPESKTTARIGLASKNNPKKYFDAFIKKIKKQKPNLSINEMQAGLIPKYNKKILAQKQDVFLVGDAATQVKATTGGGIVPGLKAAECLADSIINSTNYNWKKSIGKELNIHDFARKILDKLSASDINNLVKDMNDDKIKKVLSRIDRDNASKAVFKAVWAKPKLLLYLWFFLKNKSKSL